MTRTSGRIKKATQLYGSCDGDKENVGDATSVRVKRSSSSGPDTTTTTARTRSKRTKSPKLHSVSSVEFDEGDSVTSGAVALVPGSPGSPGVDRVSTVVRKSVRVCGRSCVDSEFPLADQCTVVREDSCVWECMLNQTNLQRNNNKFYLVQVLRSDVDRSYHVWMRWGRVGYSGQRSHTPCADDLDRAKQILSKKFYDKTLNKWEDRDSFEKVEGKYDLVKTDFSVDEPDGAPAPGKAPTAPETASCTLPERLRLLIELICDIQMMRQTVVQMEYDANRAPLGKLTEEQIRSGYEALKQIDTLVRSGRSGGELRQACSDFYTRIPHYFGMRCPPVIQSCEQVQAKMRLLETLGDIQLALKVINPEESGSLTSPMLHPVDCRYRALNCSLDVVSADCDEFQLISQYVSSTHGSTHRGYKLRVSDVMSVRRDEEWRSFDNRGNCRLLWHGSRLTNWAGILAAGLKIAPPEAPSTGYMFGKGIYFADVVSKSANYCWSTPSRPEGILVLCEVALGKSRELTEADDQASRLPPGYDSVLGLGRHSADTSYSITTSDGMYVPLGPLSPVSERKTSLLYNEYIVYSVRQVRMRYLVRVQFEYV